jgi:hypothetical protein
MHENLAVPTLDRSIFSDFELCDRWFESIYRFQCWNFNPGQLLLSWPRLDGGRGKATLRPSRTSSQPMTAVDIPFGAVPTFSCLERFSTANCRWAKHPMAGRLRLVAVRGYWQISTNSVLEALGSARLHLLLSGGSCVFCLEVDEAGFAQHWHLRLPKYSFFRVKFRNAMY